MLVEEQFRKAVAFLSTDLKNESGETITKFIGTAFFMSVPLNDVSSKVYAVTARHVVEGSRPNGNLHINVNRTDGSTMRVFVPHDDWVLNFETDVAATDVTHLSMADPPVDWKHIGLSQIVDDEFQTAKGIGEGDEVFFASLFQGYSGGEQFRPIARFGRISLMPYEQIPVNLDPGDSTSKTDIYAYLVEAQSWGGESGAPAFIVMTSDRVPGMLSAGGGDIRLLGLVHGHYKLDEKVANVDGSDSASVGVNSGIALVIPAADIAATLKYDVFTENRNVTLQKLEADSEADYPVVETTDPK
ncbi:MAG: hypothetical protein IH960_10455 [Chloroflexi bacterium]|nr:hypothetical protein [Chloroflexota bacterium]